MLLSEIRQQIDVVDGELLRLLNERAALVHQVGDIKKRDGLEIYAPEREEALMQKLVARSAANQGLLPEKSIRAIYREIMSAALALEEDLHIAYLGPAGSWTHLAAINKFGASVAYAPLTNFQAVFDQVARRVCDYGVVPIENSTEGTANHTLDLFVDSPLKICSQILLRVDNCLLSNSSKEKIRRIYSHPQVFEQCQNYLNQHFSALERIEVSSTSRAAQMAAQEPGAAAIAGALAAEMYEIQILEKSVQDLAVNITRFLVIGQRTCPPTGKDRTTILFAVKDRAGSLYHALQPFSQFNINLCKMQSRPSRRREWESFFFTDILGHCEDEPVRLAIEQLAEHCNMVKVLGSYPNTGLEMRD